MIKYAIIIAYFYLSRSFATQAELETHILVNHNTVGLNECVYCQKTFKEKRLLRQHMITHKQQKRFSCKYCEKGKNYHSQIKVL